MNILMAVAGTLLAAGLTGFVGAKGRVFKKSQVHQDVDNERRRLLREEEDEYGTIG
jgi:hypothetical protein